MSSLKSIVIGFLLVGCPSLSPPRLQQKTLLLITRSSKWAQHFKEKHFLERSLQNTWPHKHLWHLWAPTACLFPSPQRVPHVCESHISIIVDQVTTSQQALPHDFASSQTWSSLHQFHLKANLVQTVTCPILITKSLKLAQKSSIWLPKANHMGLQWDDHAAWSHGSGFLYIPSGTSICIFSYPKNALLKTLRGDNYLWRTLTTSIHLPKFDDVSDRTSHKYLTQAPLTSWEPALPCSHLEPCQVFLTDNCTQMSCRANDAQLPTFWSWKTWWECHDSSGCWVLSNIRLR